MAFAVSIQYSSFGVPIYLLVAYPSSYDKADDMKELYNINTSGKHSKR